MARRAPTAKRTRPIECMAKFEPRSPAQQKVVDAYQDNDILILTGPAGTGKTFAALGASCTNLVANPTKQLVLLRPEVEAGKSLGHLPGTLDEKIAPFMEAFKQILRKVAFGIPEDCISFQAVGFARGITYEHSIVIIDEAQNLTFAQCVLLLTRLGVGSKMIFSGDPDQVDIKPSVPGYDVDLDAVVDALDGLERVKLIEFPASHSLRHPLISKMLKRLDAIKR